MPVQIGSLRLPASLERLEEFRTFVLDCASEAGLPPAQHAKLELVIEEMLVNVISYAYPAPGEDGEIELGCSSDEGGFEISIRDWGSPFDPTVAPPPDLDQSIDERPIGGLGILFVKKMTDDLAYMRDGESNVLTMSFRIPDAA